MFFSRTFFFLLLFILTVIWLPILFHDGHTGGQSEPVFSNWLKSVNVFHYVACFFAVAAGISGYISLKKGQGFQPAAIGLFLAGIFLFIAKYN